MKNILTLLLLAFVTATPGLAEKIELPAGRSLNLRLPPTWTGATLPATPKEMPATATSARYATKSGSNDAVLVSALIVPDERFLDPEALKAMVEQATAQFVEGSVEGRANLTDFSIGRAHGLSVTFRDAALAGKPSVKDDYKAMTACFVYLGDHVMLTATVFTDDPDGPAYAEGIKILKSITLLLPADSL
jgi:hypothetical protein